MISTAASMLCFKAFSILCLVVVVIQGSSNQTHDPLNQKIFAEDPVSGNILTQDVVNGVLANRKIFTEDVHKQRALFKEFMATYGKIYTESEEQENRFNIFVENLKKAQKYQNEERGTAQYGITKFSDLTAEEFKQNLGLRPELHTENLSSILKAKIPKVVIPDNFDWRTKKVVTEVKRQGECGACWAFTTVANIESLYAIKHNKLISLSEQELLDCDYLDKECIGGLMTRSYAAIIELGGLVPEKDYPYVERKQEKCQLHSNSSSFSYVKIRGGVTIGPDENDMAKYVYTHGPISAGINSDDMQFYERGIAHPMKESCNPKTLDHAVTVVGFGKCGNISYWLAKNSWGPNWGEKGYYKLYRGDGSCGINTLVSSAIL